MAAATATKTPKKTPKSKVLDDGTVLIHGVIGDEWDGLDSATLVEEIHGLEGDDDGNIRVNINSPGGMVTDGLSIYNELLTHPANVIVEITGVAASMASVIACAGDTVRIAQNGLIMIHDPWNVAVGDADDLRKAADVLEKFGDSLVGIYARKTGLEEDEIRDMMREETWLDADEALEKGFVDEVIEPVDAEAFADLDVSELAKVPTALNQLIREGRQMARARAQGDDGKNKKTPATAEPSSESEPQNEPATQPSGEELADQIAAKIEARRRERRDAIKALQEKYDLPKSWLTERLEADDSVEQARDAALETLSARQQDGPSWTPGGVGVTADERDKFLTGAASWLIIKANRRTLFKDETFDPGEFRGMTLLDLARESLHRAGVNTRGMSKMEIAGAALGRGARAEAGLGTRSDFPVLLENVLHKMLQAAYETIPDTWRMFCFEGSVSDFRPHPRLRLGSFSQLDKLLESGEFKQKHFPDAEKEDISAATKGNIVGLTRQSIVNDDVDGFSRLITMLGRAAALSIEVDVYALLAENSGLGPAMSDGNPLFDASHSNIGTGSALSVSGLDGDRVVLASQQDPESNEFLDLRPAVLVLPIGLGGEARVINGAEFDTDPVDPGTDEQNKFRKPNSVRGIFRDIVDTPRLTGTRRYMFTDPQTAPVLEVAFLDGQSSPVLETEEGFDYDGVRWRVRYDYGAGATDFRGAVTNAGA